MFSKSIKLFILTLLIFFFTFGVVAFAQQTETFTTPISKAPLPVPRVVKDRQFVLGYQCNGLGGESMQRAYAHAIIEAEHRGWKMISNVDAVSADLERAGFENLINQNVDAIIDAFGQVSLFQDLILKAREKGIGVYGVDAAVLDGIVSNSTMPQGIVGAAMVHYGVDRLNMIGNVLMFQIAKEAPYSQRVSVAKGLLDLEWPNLKVIGYEYIKGGPQGGPKQAYDFTQNYLTRFNDDIQWIYTHADSVGMHVSRALEEAGLTREDCFVTAFDGGTAAYAEIRKGSVFTVTYNQPFEGYIHDAFEAINQAQIEGIAPGAPGSMIPPRRTLYREGALTTPENVPSPGTIIHEVFAASYYDPNNKDAWYFWGEPYKVK